MIFLLFMNQVHGREINSGFLLKDCLFGGVKLAKNADPDKFIYSGYGIEFVSRSEFSLPDGSVGKSVIIELGHYELMYANDVYNTQKKKY